MIVGPQSVNVIIALNAINVEKNKNKIKWKC